MRFEKRSGRLDKFLAAHDINHAMLNGLSVIIESWHANEATFSENSFFVIAEVRGGAIVMVCPPV